MFFLGLHVVILQEGCSARKGVYRRLSLSALHGATISNAIYGIISKMLEVHASDVHTFELSHKPLTPCEWIDDISPF